MAGKWCWFCRRRPEEDDVVWGSVLVPRSARSGGPLLLFRCPGCKTSNLVERNGEGETFLSPPPAADHEPPDFDEALLYAARRWLRRHDAARRAFLAREAPSGGRKPRSSVEAPPRPPSDPPPPPPSRESEEDSGDLADAAGIIGAYEVLGLPLNATEAKIRSRYRELAKKCHPDLVSGLDEEIRRLAERKFRRLQHAFETIKDRSDRNGPPGRPDSRS